MRTADDGGPPDLGFDSRGRRRAGEIDLDHRQPLGTAIADMNTEERADLAESVRVWEAGWRP